MTDSRLRTLLCCLLVMLTAYLCFMRGRGEPAHLFWDENYHVTSAERYLQGIAHFEPHPPLGLMLIAAGEKWSGTNTGIDKHILTTTKQIGGNDMPAGFDYSGMRLMPSLFAMLGALAFFALMLELFGNRLHALLLSGLYLFENAFVVHFRAVHLDSFQMCFSLLFLWQFVRLWKRDTPLHAGHYAWLALPAALAMMIKVNSVVLLVLFPVLYFKDARTHHNSPNWPLDFLGKSGAAIATLLGVIFTVFYAHAALGPTLPDGSTSAGRQDLANMSAEYRQHLEQQTPLTPALTLHIARDYFLFMDKDHKGVPKLDVNKPGENGSHPLHWPFHDRNINYRWDSADGKTSYVQLVGNQPAWYAGTVAVFLSLLLVANYRVLGIPLRGSLTTYRLIEVFTLLYVTHMLLHLWIITQRVMYLYHYFFGLIVSYILLALLGQYVSEVHAGFARWRTTVLASVMGAFFLSFLFFLPLSNHWPLTKEECERRNISISHIVSCR